MAIPISVGVIPLMLCKKLIWAILECCKVRAIKANTKK